MKMMSSTAGRVAVVILCLTQVTGCGLGYYWQATTGHLKMMRQARPVPDVIADESTRPEVREGLEVAVEAVDFAHEFLLLPDNGSYRSYADIGRPYVVWNVFAAPEFSLEPSSWCFPVAGCVNYRGYFDADKATNFADGLAQRGDDVFVGGVTAYSTLGRFDDPLLNTMIELPSYQIAALIFHELAHQRVYVKGDSKFNEGFASFVEREGLNRWLREIDDEASLRRYRLSLGRIDQAQALMLRSREALDDLYSSDIPDTEKRARKEGRLSAAREAYRDMRAGWGGPPYFDHWFDDRLNNARIAAVSTYDDFVPAFRALLNEVNGDLQAFYDRVASLAALPADEREAAMLDLIEPNVGGGAGRKLSDLQ
jgi:predicted aminopeptidase